MLLTLPGLFIALEIWGSVFTLLIAICVNAVGHHGKHSDRYMVQLLLVASCILAFDAAAWLLDGRPGRIVYYLLIISNFCLYLTCYIILWVFARYVKSLAGDSILMKPVVILVVIGCFFIILNQFNHFLYYIDKTNEYHRGPYFLFSQMIGVVGMLFLAAAIISKRKALGMRRTIILLTYLVLPILALLIQAFYYGMPFMNSAIAVAAVISFNVMTIDQRRMLMLQEAEIINRDEKLKREREKLDDMRIRLVFSQVKPHFLYNVLNSIYYLIDKSPSEAQSAIDSFSSYLRGNMAALESRGCIPFSREMEHVKSYLFLEKMRFQEELEVIYDLQTFDFEIPAFSVEPLVENAVKHGIGRKEDGGYVRIGTEETDEGFIVRIEDNGVGFNVDEVPDDGNPHVGVENVRKRLETIAGGTLKVESTIGKGTCATIFLPKSTMQSKPIIDILSCRSTESEG